MRDWKKYVDQFEPSEHFKDDVIATRVCQLAAVAGELGTYAVGAVLLDDKGTVLAEGHNESFIDGFRSDLHAEMVVLNKFETGCRGSQNPVSLTLISSLEPCPMCTSRLIYAGIGSIRYICEDPHGGMVTRLSALPPKLQEISEDLSQSWGPADCSEDLREAAHQLLEQNREIADRRLVERGWGGNPDT